MAGTRDNEAQATAHAGGRGGHKMKNEKLIKEAFEAVNGAMEMLTSEAKYNEPWISFYIGKAWAYLDLIMNENAEEENE